MSNDEFAAVQAAAASIHPLHRGAFLQALAKELEQHPVVGPGLVHRLAATGRYVIAPEHETSAAAEPREHLARQVWR